MFQFNKSLLPTNPGVYIFKDRFENIIYIGKANNLRNRISSYFLSSSKYSPKTIVLVKNIFNLDFIIVDNELEALLLENKLIKKHKPKYNINLKDNKTYPYIKITNSKIPKIISTRIIKDDGNYFGPFSDATLRWNLINLVVELFQLITPKTFSSRSKINYEIGLSPAREEREIEIEKYLKKVDEAKDFLKGKNINKLVKKLEVEMGDASKNQEFEIANFKKKQIENILRILEKQKVDLIKNYDQDVVVILNDKTNEKSLIVIINILRGTISKKREFRFDFYEELFEDFLKMYYSKNSIPKEIIVSVDFWKTDEEKKVFEDYFSKKKGSKVLLIFPQKGEKKSLLELAKKNAQIIFKENILESIQKKLSLPKLPKIIECFDMSNLGHEHQVGAMTRWENGVEIKDENRRFEIKSFKNKQDDYRAMKEVIYRRYKRVVRGERLEVGGNRLKKTTTSYLQPPTSNHLPLIPDLIIIDGGKGQLSSAISSLKELGVKIPIISIKKGVKRDRNDVFIMGKTEPIVLDNNSKEMLYLRKVRDSVHNYVIAYNRKKRDMKFRKEVSKI